MEILQSILLMAIIGMQASVNLHLRRSIKNFIELQREMNEHLNKRIKDLERTNNTLTI